MKSYNVKKFPGATKRYCRTMDLKNDPSLIEEYRKFHSEEYAWPEIRQGIKDAGILEMEIYIFGNRLFMIMETPADFDWDSAMDRLSKMPRQEEWERFMAKFQDCGADDSATDKWQMMERMFYLYD